MASITVTQNKPKQAGGFGIDPNTGKPTAKRQADAAKTDAAWQGKKQGHIDSASGKGFDANSYVANMDRRQLESLVVDGANLATKEERLAAKAAAEMRLKSMRTNTAPTNHGMNASGQQQGMVRLPPPNVTNPGSGQPTTPIVTGPPPTPGAPPADPAPDYNKGGLLEAPTVSDSSQATVGPEGFARGSMGQSLHAPAYASVTNQPRHHHMTYLGAKSFAEQVNGGPIAKPSVPPAERPTVPVPTVNTAVQPETATFSAPATQPPSAAGPAQQDITELMQREPQELEASVRQVQEFQQLQQMTASMQGRQPTPEEQQEMDRLSQIVMSIPAYQALASRMAQFTPGASGGLLDPNA